jgi:acetyltransferase-like isoleucine patch superfamily enzyme
MRQMVYGYRRFRLRLAGIEVHSSTKIASRVTVRNGFANNQAGKVTSGESNEWMEGVILDAHGGKIQLGDHVHLGPYSVIYGHGDVTIGNNTLIGPQCCIVSFNHQVPPLGSEIRHAANNHVPVVLGEDTWLGAGVKILAGVTLGDGCIIGAGAVVTRSLPAGTIAHGIPAKAAGTRPPAE